MENKKAHVSDVKIANVKKIAEEIRKSKTIFSRITIKWL
jgi:hypothetical protein